MGRAKWKRKGDDRGLDNDRGGSQNVITQTTWCERRWPVIMGLHGSQAQACEPVTHTVSLGDIRFIHHPADGDTKSQWKRSFLVTQQVQGTGRIKASKTQNQTIWLHHYYWARVLAIGRHSGKRKHDIETQTQALDSRLALGLISCVSDAWHRL